MIEGVGDIHITLTMLQHVFELLELLNSFFCWLRSVACTACQSLFINIILIGTVLSFILRIYHLKLFKFIPKICYFFGGVTTLSLTFTYARHIFNWGLPLESAWSFYSQLILYSISAVIINLLWRGLCFFLACRMIFWNRLCIIARKHRRNIWNDVSWSQLKYFFWLSVGITCILMKLRLQTLYLDNDSCLIINIVLYYLLNWVHSLFYGSTEFCFEFFSWAILPQPKLYANYF